MVTSDGELMTTRRGDADFNERVLFLDDNICDVEAARRAGFSAARVDGVEGSRQALVEAGVIGAG